METLTSSSLVRLAIALALSLLLGKRGLKKQSLDQSGAVAAFAVGFLTLACGYRFGALLLGFYFTGSKLTKVRAHVKVQLDENYKVGGQRSAGQVLACSAIATMIAVYHILLFGDAERSISFSQSKVSAILLTSYIGHYACCAADTWASELGVLSKSNPVLITTLKRVPPGTNGAISLVGTVASVLGGAFMGVLYLIVSLFSSTAQVHVITLGAIMGLIGSLIDSLLGATVQSTWYNRKSKKICAEGAPHNSADATYERLAGINVLTNEQVNLVSVLLTTILSGFVGQLLFP
ncbi:TPA: hypothetical protein N0F65_000247 [Lagenidium giganteum]|uniref:Transmembrane protein 19 n=1 Tax=Lagenidium giganteum TaxID=4803 RepID=A0AAV2ZBL9_9STRA|nr:TPA: hypothetical protein N0F65_000247 [Lagenidium giganteum]